MDGSFRDVRDVWMSRSKGRNTGMHWTMIVPTISEEYQMFVAPKVPFVFYVALVLPACAHCRHDSNNHSLVNSQLMAPQERCMCSRTY
jgi:hypothetical protein